MIRAFVFLAVLLTGCAPPSPRPALPPPAAPAPVMQLWTFRPMQILHDNCHLADLNPVRFNAAELDGAPVNYFKKDEATGTINEAGPVNYRGVCVGVVVISLGGGGSGTALFGVRCNLDSGRKCDTTVAGRWGS